MNYCNIFFGRCVVSKVILNLLKKLKQVCKYLEELLGNAFLPVLQSRTEKRLGNKN